MSIFKNADQLKNLPTDDEELSVKEKTVLNMLYPDEEEEEEKDEEKNDNKLKNVKSGKNNKNVPNVPNVPNVQNVPKDIEKTWFHFNDIIIATILFIILSIPVSDKIIEKIVKIENFYYRLAAKSLVFAILLFFINNFALARKKSV